MLKPKKKLRKKDYDLQCISCKRVYSRITHHWDGVLTGKPVSHDYCPKCKKKVLVMTQNRQSILSQKKYSLIKKLCFIF